MYTNLSKTPPFISTSKYPPETPHFLIISGNPWKFTHKKSVLMPLWKNLHCLTPVTNTDTYSSTTPQAMHRLFSKQHYHDPNTQHLLHVFQFVSHGSNNKYPAFQFHHRGDTNSQLLSRSQDTDHTAPCPTCLNTQETSSHSWWQPDISLNSVWAPDKPTYMQ